VYVSVTVAVIVTVTVIVIVIGIQKHPHGSTCILDVFLPVKHSHRGNIVQDLPFRPGQNIPASFLLPAYIICVAVSHADLPVPLIVMPELGPDQGPQHLRPAQTVKSQFIEVFQICIKGPLA